MIHLLLNIASTALASLTVVKSIMYVCMFVTCTIHALGWVGGPCATKYSLNCTSLMVREHYVCMHVLHNIIYIICTMHVIDWVGGLFGLCLFVYGLPSTS